MTIVAGVLFINISLLLILCITHFATLCIKHACALCYLLEHSDHASMDVRTRLYESVHYVSLCVLISDLGAICY